MGTLLVRRGQPCEATPTGLWLIRHHDEVALLERALAQDLPGGPASPPRCGSRSMRTAWRPGSSRRWRRWRASSSTSSSTMRTTRRSFSAGERSRQPSPRIQDRCRAATRWRLAACVTARQPAPTSWRAGSPTARRRRPWRAPCLELFRQGPPATGMGAAPDRPALCVAGTADGLDSRLCRCGASGSRLGHEPRTARGRAHRLWRAPGTLPRDAPRHPPVLAIQPPDGRGDRSGHTRCPPRGRRPARSGQPIFAVRSPRTRMISAIVPGQQARSL